MTVTVSDVRRVALTLPRTTEHVIRDRIKFRVGAIVYVAFSRDETSIGFGYPREERQALIASAPGKFFLEPADARYQWISCWMQQLGAAEMEEFVCESWRMCVPKFLAHDRLGD
jgi:hypothetical protein